MKDIKILIVFAFILFCSCSFVGEQVNCFYIPKKTQENPSPEISKFENCGCLDKTGVFKIHDRHLKKLSFDTDQLSTVYIDTKVYYISGSGKTIRALYYDNGADYFSEDLARTVINGKIGYFDRALNIVIPPTYDFAFPFTDGKAVVCIGCKSIRAGEHQRMTGGKWGIIDKKGEVIVPIRYNRENLPK